MYRTSLRSISCAIALMACVIQAHATIATTGQIYLKGDPGSWVGGGLDVTWTHGVDGVLYANESSTNGLSLLFNNGGSWNFDFFAPMYNPSTNTVDGQPLSVGMYTGAQRYPFNSPTKPGLAVSGDGRGDNILSGWFNVLDIGYDGSGHVSRFAVDFKQFDETSTSSGPGTYGSIRFNSDIPLNLTPVPESSTMMMMGIGLVGIVGLSRRSKLQ